VPPELGLELLLGDVLLGLVLRAAGGVVLLGVLPGCELFGVVPLLGLVVLGVEPLLGAFGVALGFRFPGVTPPLGVVGVPGASGGVTPGGDELDGAAFDGDLLVDGAPLKDDGACEGDADDGAPPAGAADVCACAAVAAARPSAAATATTCNLSIHLPF
jgi:hypothetical protein